MSPPIAQQVNRSSAQSRYLPLELVVGAGLIASIAVTVFLVRFHHHLSGPKFTWLDYWLPNFLNAHASPGLTVLMKVFTAIGSPLEVALYFLVAVGILLFRRRWGEAIAITGSEIGAVLLNQTAKTVFQRHRPTWSWALVHETNYSFPSGHAMLGIISFGTIAFMLWRYYPDRTARAVIVTVAALLIFGIGLSRIYLGVHFPSDILAGWIAGGIWLATVIVGTSVLHRIEPKLRAPEEQMAGAGNPSG